VAASPGTPGHGPPLYFLHEERAEDGHDADEQRYRRRHDAPEDEQQQDRKHREGDQLRLGQIAASLVVDLAEARGEAPDRHLERIRADAVLGVLGRFTAFVQEGCDGGTASALGPVSTVESTGRDTALNAADVTSATATAGA